MLDTTSRRWVYKALAGLGLAFWVLLAAQCGPASPSPTPTLAPAFQTLFAATPIPSQLALSLHRPSDTPAADLDLARSAYPQPPSSPVPTFTPLPKPSLTPTPSPTITLTPSVTPTNTEIPTPTMTWTPTDTPTPLPTATPTMVYSLVNKGIRLMTVRQPVLKGQVRDAQGRLITDGRASVGVSINGVYRDTEWFRNPQPTNVDGWYEIYVSPWQVVRIVRLFIDDREVTLVGASRYWTAQSRQWWHVDLRQR
jgi:hypothetical protein